MLEKVIAKESTRTTANNDGLCLSLIRVPSQSRDINTKVLFTHFAIVVDIPAPHYQIFSYLTKSFSESCMDNVQTHPCTPSRH